MISPEVRYTAEFTLTILVIAFIQFGAGMALGLWYCGCTP